MTEDPYDDLDDDCRAIGNLTAELVVELADAALRHPSNENRPPPRPRLHLVA